MSLVKRFDDDLKAAMKASESLKVSVLRMLKAALKNRQIEKGGDLSDEDVVTILSSMVKQRRDSVDQFSAAGRLDLADKEKQEIEMLQVYMPPQLGPEEIDSIIAASIREASAQNPSDIGKVMKILMPKLKGLADGKYVNQRVKEIIESKGSG